MEHYGSPTSDLTQHEATFRFGEFELDVGARELRRGGQPVPLTPKSLLVLIHLVGNRGRVVSRAELMKAHWPAVRVAPGSLTQAIWEIRKVLQEPRKGSRIIETLRRRGYRFTARIEERPRFGSHAATRLDVPNAHELWPAPLLERMGRLSPADRTMLVELATLLARDSEAAGHARAHHGERSDA